ncbi:DUF6221 family protein [Streptosporangium subroseum]|uniref:DUF6221 family protein n=1 Tax=Streptosporangium subroseum TaxID=106412 RepID=UPI003422F7BE
MGHDSVRLRRWAQVAGCLASAPPTIAHSHTAIGIAVRRRIIDECEQTLHTHDRWADDWPAHAINIWHILGALALPYELHTDWRETWRP